MKRYCQSFVLAGFIILWMAPVIILFPRHVWASGEPPDVVSITPAAGADTRQEEETENRYMDSLLEDMQLEEVQELLDNLLGEESFDFMDSLKKLITGEMPLSKETFFQIVYKGVFGELDRQRQVLLQIILIIIAGALFANFSKMFESGQIGEISFYVVYLILFALLVDSFGALSSHLTENLETIVTLMKAVAPAYFIAITAASGISTATMFYQIVLVMVLAIQAVILHFILPCINLYILLQLVNHLSKEDVLSKLAELLQMVVEWSLRTLLGVIIGLQVIQGLVAPVIDSLKRTTLGKTASAIPGVGNAMNAVTEIILTSAVLIRNSMGVIFLVVFIIWGVTPLIRYVVSALVYKLLAAVTQPVSDKRMVGCLNTMSEGCVLLLKTFFTVQILCMVTIVILAANQR